VVLAGNFVLGGSRIGEAFALTGMNAVLAYGFFGQVMWMFGGIALLMLFARTSSVRNLAPGMAGALSHAGLTGACTAGDLGELAARRAPIMINIPFFGHVFVFSILALSVERGALLVGPALGRGGRGSRADGAVAAQPAARRRGGARGEGADAVLVRLAAVRGVRRAAAARRLSGMPVEHALMAKSSSVSHFGLFAAIQGGMAGEAAQALIAFVFAMPFLVHPLVFFMFGRAMERDGEMPRLGVVGVVGSLAFVS
jgi:hypothetical protein